MGRYVEGVIDEIEWLRKFSQQRMSKLCSNEKRLRC